MPRLLHHNASKGRRGRHYSLFYNEDTKSYVYNRFKNEIELLEYKYEEEDLGEDNIEVCIGGCGATSKRFPVVGVTEDKETGEFAAFPVCEDCWRDPSHRETKLAMHFFPREQEDVAVAMAGSDSIGG